MKLISFVPSLTETLIKCGISVQGRTRFCIHPQDEIRQIPVIGGTKDLKWEAIEKIEPDFALLDREENTLEMAESLQAKGIQLLLTHVQNLSDLARDLKGLSVALRNSKLEGLGQFAQRMHEKKPLRWNEKKKDLLFEEILPQSCVDGIDEITYLIWKDPWMCVDSQTYVADILSKTGLKIRQRREFQEAKNHYPKIDLNDNRDTRDFFLFSSEPYPFRKKKLDLIQAKLPGALVDGEKFSWFGVRSLQFLAEYYEEKME